MAIELADLCNTVQQNLNELAGSNYPALNREGTGFLDSVMSPRNRSGFSQKYATDDGDGKLKQIVREWAVPIPYTTAVSSEQNICGAGTEEARIQDVVELTGYTGTRVMEFSDAELRKYCEKPSAVITMRIAQHMSGLFRALNRAMIASYLTQYGAFIGGDGGVGDTPVDLSLLFNDGVTEAAIPDGEVKLMEDMNDLGIGRPIVVGAGPISRYARLANIGCCNDYGQSIDQLAGSYDYYRDRDLAQVADGEPQDPIIVYSPGAVQLATYNKYRDEFDRVVKDMYSRTTTVDPVTGLRLDTKLQFDECAEKWKMQFGIHWELFTLPLAVIGANTGMFKTADERAGVNYAFLYNGVVLEPAP